MSIQPGSSKLAGRHSVPEIQKKQKSQIKKILLQLLNYQGALSVGYHRQYSFYRRRLFTAYVTMFNVEESNLICIFAGEGRNEVIRRASMFIRLMAQESVLDGGIRAGVWRMLC